MTKLKKNVDVRSIKSLMKSVDVLKYFKKSGLFQFPSVAVLARIVLAKLDNSGYTERMFSAGSNAMSKKQTKMCFENLEKRVVLHHNRDYMRKLRNGN